MTEPEIALTPEQIHEILFTAYASVAELRGRCELVSSDTGFAIGMVLGTIGQAKALVGRDIDQARKMPNDRV